MKLTNSIKATLFALGMIGACSTYATTTYTYTDSSDASMVPRFRSVFFSGSFSVASALADGAYSFALAAAQPAGFTEQFFTQPVAGATGTSIISVFDITLENGQVSAWDIETTTPYTRVSYSGGRVMVPAYHAAILTLKDSTTGNSESSYDVGLAYQNAAFVSDGPGVWSIATTADVRAVPEPETYLMVMAGLGLLGAVARRRKTSRQ
jgi:hypothetical protein